MKTKVEQTFTCNKWLASDKDNVLERTLYPDSEKNGAGESLNSTNIIK